MYADENFAKTKEKMYAGQKYILSHHDLSTYGYYKGMETPNGKYVWVKRSVALEYHNRPERKEYDAAYRKNTADHGKKVRKKYYDRTKDAMLETRRILRYEKNEKDTRFDIEQNQTKPTIYNN